MTLALGILLLLNAAFNFFVWPTFYKRVARDPRALDSAGKPTRFLTVHRVIVGAAYLLGAVSAVLGVIGIVTAH